MCSVFQHTSQQGSVRVKYMVNIMGFILKNLPEGPKDSYSQS